MARKYVDPTFAPGERYVFKPIETACMCAIVNGGAWTTKKFTSGTCLSHDKKEGIFVFQGPPVGEELQHLFLTKLDGKGNVVPAPKPSPAYRLAS